MLLLFGCTASAPELPRLILGESIEIDFQTTPMFFGNYSWGFYEDLFYYNSDHVDSMGLHQYAFETNAWESIYFQYEGPNGLKRNDSFVVLKDSLAYHALSGNFGFQLVHLKTKLTENFIFPERLINPGPALCSSIYFDGERIGFPITEYKSTQDPAYTKSAKIYGIFSLKERDFINFIPFPEDFHGQVFSTNFLRHTCLVLGDSIFINFAKSDYIYGYDLEGNQLFKKHVGTEGIKTDNPGRKSDPMENMLLTELGGKYTGFGFDGTHFYRTSISFPSSPKQGLTDLFSIEDAFASSTFHVLKLNRELDIIAQGTFSGAPGKGGVGDGLHFVRAGKLYLWDLDKSPQENIEKFVSVEFEKN